VTVSVTPVGNVVILGVPVLSREAVTDLDTVVVEHLDPLGDGLADLERVVSPDGLWLTERRPVAVCFSLDVVVLETAGVTETFVLALKDGDAEDVLLVEIEAVVVLEWADDADKRPEPVSEFVAVEKGVVVVVGEGVRVRIVLAVSVWDSVVVRVPATEAETVLEIGGVLETGAVLDSEGVVEGQGEGAGVAVVVLVIGGVPVALGSFVEVVDAVDVLEAVIDLVPDRVLIGEGLLRVEPVVVRLCNILLVVVVVAVDDRDWLAERVPDALPVGVLEGLMLLVGVLVGGAEAERPVVLVKEVDDEAVLERVTVLETDVEAEAVLEDRIEVDGDGVTEVVLELLADDVPVLDAVVVLVGVVLLVVVLEGPRVRVGFDVELAVLDRVAVRVAVVVLKGVALRRAVGVLSRVGIAVFVAVVVRVEVLDKVADCDGATAGGTAVPVYKRPIIIHRRKMFIRPYTICGDYY
jgi:hypothetical protein